MSKDGSEPSRLSVAMPTRVHVAAEEHLLQFARAKQRQENACFALWRRSAGANRITALVHDLVLPNRGEVILRGNVSFTAEYLARASQIAADENSGIALMHNHFGPGWQGMSPDDVRSEETRAAFALTSTGLPLLGMTLGTDGAWSARLWPRAGPKNYCRKWGESVRVVGKQLNITFNPSIFPAPERREELARTISAWGEVNQASLARTHIGIVGLGSVGRMVLEGLARMGIQRVTLIDFDRIERVNLDRLLGAFPADVGELKVDVARDGFMRASTARDPDARVVSFAVSESVGFEEALDCDVLFSCVDRPWGRQVLNHIAYAHLIPVIDGGILIRTTNGKFKGAEWSIRTVGPERCCLKCCGQFDPGLVDMERKGLLDDPSYIEGLTADERAEASQNVFPFSMCVAGHEIVQLASLVTGLLHRPDLGDQRYHYNLAEMRSEERVCGAACIYQGRIASGDSLYPRETMTGEYPKAAASRVARKAVEQPPLPCRQKLGRLKRVIDAVRRLFRRPKSS
jgi:molybdopterin/thiamine biosynthesis adenylyltransferase